MTNKLNIQPISKKRLLSTVLCIITESKGWKDKLKSGDLVVIEKDWSNKDIDIYIYLSKNDIFEYKYNDILLFGVTTEASEGLFVRYRVSFGNYGYLPVNSFDDNVMRSPKNPMEYKSASGVSGSKDTQGGSGTQGIGGHRGVIGEKGKQHYTRIIAIYRFKSLKPQPFTDNMLKEMPKHRENATLIYKSKDFDNIRNI